jgi:alpha-L-fucosidase
VIQPSFLVHPNGNLQLLSRSRQKAIVSTFSKDGGKSWSPLQALDLPNPNSGSDALTLQDRRHILVYNPMQPGKDWWEGRSVLSVALSSNGLIWTPVMNLEEHASGEYSYPAVVQDAKGDIWITYTYNRKNIKYVRLRIQ